jgi:hypothetical protein
MPEIGRLCRIIWAAASSSRQISDIPEYVRGHLVRDRVNDRPSLEAASTSIPAISYPSLPAQLHPSRSSNWVTEICGKAQPGCGNVREKR